jgi:hypothetical protein
MIMQIVCDKQLSFAVDLWFGFVFLIQYHTVKAYCGGGGVAPLICCTRHYLDTLGQLHDPDALLPGKVPPVPLG